MKYTILLTMTAVASIGSSSAAVLAPDPFNTASSASGTLDGVGVTFTSSQGSFVSTATNAELFRATENINGGSGTTYTFSSATGFDNFTLLVHNLIGERPTGGNSGPSNVIDNFVITYADGTTATGSAITVANIGSGLFDVSGIDGEPNGLANAFDNSEILINNSGVLTANSNETQGSGLITFGASAANGGVTNVSFDLSGNGAGSVFFGFSGEAIVPEPSSVALLGLSGLALLARRR